MSNTSNTPAKPRSARKPAKAAPAAAPRQTRAQILTDLMRTEGGVTAHTLAEAVGWQLHSVRGFIAGTLKKRADLVVTTTRIDRVTRYAVADAPDDEA